MHRPTFQSWATRWLPAASVLSLVLSLALPLALPATADAARSSSREPLNLAIIEQRDALIPDMTTAQRLQYLKLEQSIEQAESDKRSGEYLAKTKPSSLDPDRDVKALVARGKKLIEQAEVTIYENQAQMIRLLESVETQQAAQQAVDLTKYDDTLGSASFESALEKEARELMEACWGLGYETLFFDGFFIRDSEALRRAGADLRNQVYDALVEIDGNTFSLTIPVDFQLKPDTKGNSRHAFSYENAAIFENDQKALLALELIAPEDSSTGLLSLRAVDLDTQQIAAQVLVKIDDLATLLGRPADGLADRLPTGIQFRDPQERIEILASLESPYTFQISDTSASGVAAICLTDSLLKNSALQIVDSTFLLEAYGASVEAPETWVGQASAQLRLTAADEAADNGNYRVTAQANDSDRILDIGTLSLNYPDVP